MKPSNSILASLAQNLAVLLFIFIFCAVSSSLSHIENFLDCLPQHSDPSSSISQAVYTPENPSFSSILQAYIRNLRFNTSSTPKPLAIVTPLDKSHVQASVICAKTNGLELRIRSGGHDYEGLSYVSSNPFVLLDMFNFRSIDIDLANETAWVQSGATLGELYYYIANKSNTHAFPAGVCPTVGVGGHFSGGGYGNMLRKFGLTVDNIIDAEIVDANGRVLNRQTMGEDLFWAIRGGGAASFCVVLSWNIKLVQIPPTMTAFLVRKTLEEGASDIVYQWQQVAPRIVPNLFIRVESKVIREGKKTVEVSFIALYLGRANDLVQLVNKEFPLLGLRHNDTQELSWLESSLFFYGLPTNASHGILLQRDPPLGFNYEKHKSDYVKTPIPKLGLEALWKKMLELENITLQFNPYGGQMGKIPETATPFPHRKGTLFKIQYLALWTDDSQEFTDRNLRGMKEMYDFMAPYVSKNPREAFLNYRDIDIGTNANKSLAFALDYFKENVPRLLKVKAAVDPTNFFRNEQSIPVLSI